MSASFIICGLWVLVLILGALVAYELRGGDA